LQVKIPFGLKTKGKDGLIAKSFPGEGRTMAILALTNHKGGTGKTTSTVNIGGGMARLGYRVLLVDLDPQASLTVSLGLTPPEDKNLFQVLKGFLPAAEAMQEKNGLQLIPAHPGLANIEAGPTVSAREPTLLKSVLSDLADFDFIFLDCPPSLGYLTLNALVWSDQLLIPVQAEFLALHGMSNLLQTIELVKARWNSHLEVGGIIATRYDNRRVLNREVVENLQEHFGTRLFKTTIRENIALAEAPGFGLDIFSYRPDSHGAEDYLALCREIIERS